MTARILHCINILFYRKDTETQRCAEKIKKSFCVLLRLRVSAVGDQRYKDFDQPFLMLFSKRYPIRPAANDATITAIFD